MYDVYLSSTKELLVVPRGRPIPPGVRGSWRRKKSAVHVSNEIRAAVGAKGYYKRKVSK